MATRRCAAQTKQGNRCRLNAIAGSRYCFVHSGMPVEIGPPPVKIRKQGPPTAVWSASSSESPPASSEKHSGVYTYSSESSSSESPLDSSMKHPQTGMPSKGSELRNYLDLIKQDGRTVAPGTLILLDGVIYSVIRRLGSGSYGVVFAVENGGNRYALKIETSQTTEQQLCAEADMQKRVETILPATPRIYRCNKFYYANIMHTYTVMELMQGSCDLLLTEMLGKIRESPGKPMRAEDARRNAITAFAHVLYIYREMIRQVDRLDSRDVYHVDIKPGNMLYSYENDHSGREILRVCLSDYGFACDMSERYKCYPRTTFSPPEWDKASYYAAVNDRDEMKRAQWYMMGLQFSDAIEDVAIKKTIGGVPSRDFFKMISPGNRFSDMMLHLNEMSAKNPSARVDRCWAVIEACDAIIWHCLSLAPGVSILWNSMLPYERRS